MLRLIGDPDSDGTYLCRPALQAELLNSIDQLPGKRDRKLIYAKR